MTGERRVRTLRLAGRSEALVRRGALLLEDALRTASLPDPGRGRVLFIRSLALGIIRADRSPSSLALSLEERVRALAAGAIHAEAQGAAAADAVYFRDAAEALVALAAALARGDERAAWFWPLVVPEAKGAARGEALRHVLAASLRTEAGPAGAVPVVEGLAARGVAAALLGELRWEDGPALARATWGYAPSPSEGVSIVRARVPDLERAPAPLREAAAESIRSWGPLDLRSVWVAAVVLAARRPAALAEPRMPERAARAAVQLAEHRPAAAREEPARRTKRRGGPRAEDVRATGAQRPRPEAPEAWQAWPEPERASPRPPPLSEDPRLLEDARARAKATESDVVREPSAPPPSEEPPAARPAERDALDAPEWTRLGGLLFLVPVLEHLGIRALLEGSPSLGEIGLGERVLAFAAERLIPVAEDPLVRALGLALAPAIREPLDFELPEAFRARLRLAPGRTSMRPEGRAIRLSSRWGIPLSVGPLATGPSAAVARSVSRLEREPVQGPKHAQAPAATPGTDLDLLLCALHAGASLVLRRLGLTMRQLLLRPARVAATPTHLDLVLDLDLADVRIRRAALDLDPGWIPWLGRVVRYHYLHGEPTTH